MPQSGMDVHHKQRPTVETVAKVVGHGYPRGRKRGIARAIGPANALLTSLSGLTNNWLRVLGTTERSQVDQRVCHQLHAIMPLLDAFKSQKQPLELVFPGKGPFDTHPQRMDGFVEEAFASALGRLSVAGILWDVGDHAGIENAFAVVCGIKATIEVKVGAFEVQTNLFGHLLQRVQAL